MASPASIQTPAAIPVAVDLVLLTLGQHELYVLLRRRAGSRWELPWEALQPGEALTASAARIAQRAAGERPGWIQQVAALGVDKQHPVGSALSVAYAGVVAAGVARIGEEDAMRPVGGEGKTTSELAWFPIERLPALPARHRQALEEAMSSIRTRFDLAPIAFRLLPERFTLSELQEVYELLLQRSIHKASFRRALHGARLVAPLPVYRSEGRGRPAQLFRFAPRKRTTTRRGVRFDFGEI